MATVTVVNPRGHSVDVSELGALEHYLRRGYVPSSGTVAAARAAFGANYDTPAALETTSGGSTLGKSNGSNDTSTIQAALDAARASGGGYVRGVTGETYRINAAAVISSGTTLDMTGCTVVLANGSGTRMVRNYSSVPAATGTAATTSGSNVITTGLAAQATVGQTLVVTDAGGTGLGPLVGIISAINTGAGTVILDTLDGRACNATATTTGKAAALHNRDSDIRVIGGYWRNGNNVPASSTLGTLFLRHADNCTIDIERFDSAITGRAIGVGSVRNAYLSCGHGDTPGVICQVSGPAAGVHVERIAGVTGDDMLAFTAGDYADQQITAGDIVGATVGTVIPVNTNANVLKVIAGAGWLLDGLRIEGGIVGDGGDGGYLVHLGDDDLDPRTTGGTYGDIDLGVISARTKHQPILLKAPNARRIKATVRHIARSGDDQAAVVIAAGGGPATIGVLELDGSIDGATIAPVQFITTTVTVAQSLISETLTGIRAAPYPNAANILAARVPLPPFVAGDAFARADAATLGTAESGQAWVTWAGTPGIVGKAAYPSANNQTKAVLAAVADGYAEITVNALGATFAEAYLIFRGVDTNNYYRFGYSSPTGLVCQKVQAGAAAGVASLAQPAFAAGRRLAVRMSGAAFTLLVDDQVVGSGSNTFQQTATLVGWQSPDSGTRFGPIYARALVGGL